MDLISQVVAWSMFVGMATGAVFGWLVIAIGVVRAWRSR